ncbi:MAG: hypothetical protein ARM1_0315 [Candidatus Micrarchaeota archaeon]|nr:MAG: hypothetical protein ARM1_0315 [Candidatus Micrarchaeota archaeon]
MNQLSEVSNKNIIVLLLDTLREDYANRGYIDYLKRNSIYFSNAIAPGSWTGSSHASLLSGRVVSSLSTVYRDFVRSPIEPWFATTKLLDNNIYTLPAYLKNINFTSVLFSNNPFLSNYTNLAKDFDYKYDLWIDSNVKKNKTVARIVSRIFKNWDSYSDLIYKTAYALTAFLPDSVFNSFYMRVRNLIYEHVKESDGSNMLDRGSELTIKKIKDHFESLYDFKNQFIFINLIEPHEEYPVDIVQDKWLYMSGIRSIDSDFIDKIRYGYSLRVRYLNKKIKKMINTFRELGLLDNAYVIITSDHGQFLGEHNMLYHSLVPYEQEARVPLIISRFKDSKLVSIKDSLDSTVSLTSLSKIILSLVRYDKLPRRLDKMVVNEHSGIIEGWDLPLLRMIRSRSKYADMLYKTKIRNNFKATAIYYKGFKLIHYFGRFKDRLYYIDKDPQEQDNIIDKRRSIAKSILSYYLSYIYKQKDYLS